MLAIDITVALGTSILAFILGMLIGISLGYVLWAENGRQKLIENIEDHNKRLNIVEQDSTVEQKRRRKNDK